MSQMVSHEDNKVTAITNRFALFREFVISTIKLVYNEYYWDPKKVASVDRWSLLGGHLCNKSSKRDMKLVVAIRRWSLNQF